MARIDAADSLETYDRVLAHPSIFNLVAERETVKLLPVENYYLPSLELVSGIDVIIFDSGILNWKENEVSTFAHAVQTLGFSEEFNRSGITVFSKRP